MRFERKESSELEADELAQLRELWADAFGDRFTSEDEQHAFGGVRVCPDFG